MKKIKLFKGEDIMAVSYDKFENTLKITNLCTKPYKIIVSLFCTEDLQYNGDLMVLKEMEICSLPIRVLSKKNTEFIYIITVFESNGEISILSGKESISSENNPNYVVLSPREKGLMILGKIIGMIEMIDWAEFDDDKMRNNFKDKIEDIVDYLNLDVPQDYAQEKGSLISESFNYKKLIEFIEGMEGMENFTDFFRFPFL